MVLDDARWMEIAREIYEVFMGGAAAAWDDLGEASQVRWRLVAERAHIAAGGRSANTRPPFVFEDEVLVESDRTLGLSDSVVFQRAAKILNGAGMKREVVDAFVRLAARAELAATVDWFVEGGLVKVRTPDGTVTVIGGARATVNACQTDARTPESQAAINDIAKAAAQRLADTEHEPIVGLCVLQHASDEYMWFDAIGTVCWTKNMPYGAHRFPSERAAREAAERIYGELWVGTVRPRPYDGPHSTPTTSVPSPGVRRRILPGMSDAFDAWLRSRPASSLDTDDETRIARTAFTAGWEARNEQEFEAGK